MMLRANPCPADMPSLLRARAGRARRRAARPAFTLIETALATVIIGVGVLAIIEAQQAFLRKNAWSTHTSTATFLANEIREMTRDWPRHDRFSGGLYFSNPADEGTLTGWGPESDENTLEDLDDLDDLDGAVFGTATPPDDFDVSATYAGPINAFREVIVQADENGDAQTIEVDGEPVTLSLQGWTQIVRVEKLDPYDYSTVVDLETQETGDDGSVLRNVDRYPLRITVTVLYQGLYDLAAPEVTTVSWIVPP